MRRAGIAVILGVVLLVVGAAPGGLKAFKSAVVTGLGHLKSSGAKHVAVALADSTGLTSLHAQALEVLDSLLRSKPALEVPDAEGATPLHIAARKHIVVRIRFDPEAGRDQQRPDARAGGFHFGPRARAHGIALHAGIDRALRAGGPERRDQAERAERERRRTQAASRAPARLLLPFPHHCRFPAPCAANAGLPFFAATRSRN